MGAGVRDEIRMRMNEGWKRRQGHKGNMCEKTEGSRRSVQKIK